MIISIVNSLMVRSKRILGETPKTVANRRGVGHQPSPPALSSSNLSHESDPSWSEWTISILAALRSRVVRRRAATRMKTEWQAIDERTLRDIGLSRYDVGLIVGDGHLWG